MRSTALDAFTDGRLPILPGDLITFPATKRTLIVLGTCDQSINIGEGKREPSAGQRVVGVMTSAWDGTQLLERWMDWEGFDIFWNITRL